MDDNRKKLYDALSKEYDMGTFEQFCKDIQDEGKRRKLYDATSNEYDYGSYDSFSRQLMGASQPQQPVSQQPTTAPVQAATTPASSAAPAPQQKWQPTEQDKIRMSYELGQMMNETQQGIKETNAKIERMVEPLTQKGRERRRLGEFQARMAGTPTHVVGFNTVPKAPAAKDDKDSLSTEQPVQSEQSPQAYGVVYDENGKARTQWVLPDGSLTSSLTEANQAEYNARNARLAHQFQNRMKEAGLDPNKPQDVQKEYLLHEKKRIEQEMNKRGRELDAKVGDFSWRDMPRGSGGAIHTYNSSTTNGRYADSKYKSLVAQLNKVNEGLDILEEAKKGKASDQWIDDSSNWASKKGKQLLAFGAGAWRGLAHAVGKVSTWDMGMTDMVTNGALYSAAVDADGKGIDNLTQEDRDLLNITAYTNAIQSENGQYLGRGYKAGTVTGESLPFMIEMMLNPASKLGTTATNKLAREAVRRFGKEAVKKATKKYLAAKIGTRLVGDVVGSAVMAGTTGQGHVTADMLNRMTGDIKFKQDENGQIVYDGREGAEDSALKAYLKAFGAQTIENHSEMVGEYFAPFLGKAASLSRKGMEKIGLGKVNKLIDDIGATNIAKMIGDFEKHTKWNGTFGEYAEEVVGSIENALLVGDNTLDTAENTGVFNLDQNIDTFLGVGLMGGFFAGAKTLSYRGPKRQALNEMSDAGKAIENAIGGNVPMMEKWGSWRNTFLVGTDEEKKAALREVMDNTDLPMNFRMGVLNFVKAAQKYEGISRAQENKVQNGEQDPVAQAYDESYDNGYDTTDPEAMNDAKNLLEMKRAQVAQDYGIENVDEVDALIGDDPLRYIDEQRQLGNTDNLQSVIDYANAKSAYDGMVQRVHDDIDSRIEESNAAVDSRVNHHDGMIHPASLKLQNEDGTDKKAYIVSGNVVMFEDGKGVDKEHSDQTIVIRDVETGEMKVIPPDLIYGLDAVIDPEEEKTKAVEAIIEEMSQTAANNVDGVVSFNEGDTYTLTDENGEQTQVTLVANEQGLVDNGDGTVNVTIDGQNVVPMSMEDIQSGVDATNMARTVQAEQERQTNGESVLNSGESVQKTPESVLNSGESVQKTPESVQYGVNDTFTLLDGEGAAIHGEVQSISDDGVEIRTDEPLNGKYVQIIPAEDFESMVESINDADGNPVWAREYADDAGTTGDTSGSPTPPTTEELVQMARGGNELAQYQLEAQGVQWKESTEAQPTALSRVPVNEETGEPMFEKADKETALDALGEVTGGNEANTTAIVTAQLDQAQKALDALKKKQPTKKAPSLKGSAMEMVKAQQEADANYNAAMEQYNGQVAEAEETLNAWMRIYALMNDRKRAVREQQEAEQRERDKQLHDAAVSQVAEQKRIAAEKAAEQAEVGTHAVNPKIKEKWDESTKVEGNANALTLADGSTIRGHYVLTEAGAASASHDINNAFEPTEGFPIDENGESVNDRDYKRDTDAQRIVRDIADNYDSRALQSPVIVSNDGVVLSGNNRTMSGDIAAQQGTDRAYIDHLREFGQMYGFTPEQIDGMKHPRVVFVPDEQLPYDASTFARFNAESQKKQSKPEQAVKLGKVVPDNVFNSIVGDISRYDRLSDYYADDKAVSFAISQLQRAGVINEMQLPEMRTGNALSAAGRELIENTLIGKVFQTSPDAVRQIIATPTLRQSVIMGLNEIAHNRTLAKNGYDLSQELGAAVDLVARAKSVHPDIFKDGMPVSPFGRQQGLFDDEYGDSRVTDAIVLLLSDVLNSGKPSDLRKFLSVYNNEAVSPAGGQLDVFSGEVTSKEDLLNRITEYFRNATPREQQAIVDAAIAERKQRAETTAQDADGIGRDGENPAKTTAENGSVGLRNDGRGRTEGHSDQRQDNLAETGDVDENGHSFVKSSDGTTAFGEITEDSGLTAAPIRLSEGFNNTDEKGNNIGYGLLHIEAGHGKQILEAGYSSVPEFVEDVCRNYKEIRIGRNRKSSQTYMLLELHDEKHKRTLYVELSHDGTYWNVNSGGIFRNKYTDKNDIVWPEPTMGSNAITDTAEVTDSPTEVAKGETVDRGGNSSQPISSVDKIINNQSTLQENGEKSSENKDVTPLSEQIATASAEVNTNPTEAQKEAGNYKKGHVQVGTFDITIEQPQGSVRRGTDANGKAWESKMHNTYGYFRGTEGVDGDHIDVFLSNDIDGWNGRKVYVVDQYSPDGTFDEHKVMLGFNDMDEAKSDYLANYEKGWEDGRRIVVSATNLEDFEKWIDSSHRKTKPFAEYKSVNRELKKTKGSDGEEIPHPELNRGDRNFLLEEGHLAYLMAGSEVNPLGHIGENGKSFDEQHYERFCERYRNSVGDYLFKKHEKYLHDFFDYFKKDRDSEKAPKTKPFADAGVKKETDMAAPAKTETKQTESKGYSITPSTYTNKKGKTSDVSLLTFDHDLTPDQERAVKEFAKERIGEGRFAPARGWKDRESGGWMFRSEEDARKAAEMVGSEDAVADNQPLSISNLRETEGTVTQESIQEEDIFEKAERIAKEEQAKRKAEENARMVHEAVGKNYTRESVTEEGKPYTETMTILSADGKMVETDMNTVAYGGHYSMPIEKAAEELNENGWVEQTTSVDGATATLGHKPTSEKPKKNPSGNKLVTDERYEELKKRMKSKLRGQMNMGIDPEILAIGTEMAVYHIEKGARKFAEYAKGMIDDLGDEIRPYLKAFYNGARDLPEVEEMGLAKDMTSYDDVRTFDVANFDKQSVSALATAEQVVAEQETTRQAEEAKKKLTAQRNEKRKERNLRAATEEDLEQNPVIYYKGEPHRILMVKHEGEQVGALAFSKPKITGVYLENGKEVQLTDLQVEDNISHDDGNSDIHRTFAMAVKDDMLSSLDNGTKPYRSILDLRKRASGLGMDVDSDGRTDILLQELVEDGLVRAAREVVQRNDRDSRETYDLICKLYEMQPAISARSSTRIKMQQYSTPLPMAWNAVRFAMSGKENGKVLEPTAGNGMLVFAVPAGQVHANELDETRLANLREQGFAEVTRQDATEPFEGGQQYDAVIANPPFGKRDAVEYDGKVISGLDPQITLNALASMKDDGRAAIIIGGNMEYAKNGGLNSMKPFFTYLYDHYNVKGVVDMDGKMYAKQGTTYPTRMILIDGRRSEEERAQSAVYPPVESKAVRKAETFGDLYKIVEELTNSTEKTNGTEILRSQQGQLIPDSGKGTGRSNGKPNSEQHPAHDGDGRRHGGHDVESAPQGGEGVLRGEHRTDTGNGTPARGTGGDKRGGSRGTGEPVVRGVDGMGVPTDGVGLTTVHEEPKKRTLTEEKLAYRPHNTAFSLESVAPAAMVEAMDKVLAQIEKKEGGIDEFVTRELGYDTIEDAHNALAAEQMDSVAMAIYQMKQGQAMIIGDQTGVGKGRQMAALIRWAVKRGEKPVFITQKADLFSDIYRDLVDVGSGDLVPFIFNSPTGENKGEMVDANGKVVHKGLSDAKMKKVLTTGKLPDDCDYAVLTYSQVNTGDAISQEEAKAAARKNGSRTKKSKSDGKATPKATFLRAIAKDNYLFLDESHTAAGTSNTGAYLQSILRDAKAATFASATFAKRPDTMPLYAIRTAMSQAKVEPDKMIGIIEKGGVTLQEIMSRELTNAGQMVRRERDMSDVRTDWKTIDDAETVKRARDNYDRTITAFNAIIKFQEDYVKPLIDNLDQELAVMAESAGIKRGTDKLGVDNVPFVSKTYNYTKQLMLALKVDAIVDEVDAEIKAGRHPVIALESTMESSIKDYAAGEVIDEPTFSASLLRGLDSVMQYTVKDENGKENHAYYTPEQLGEAGEKAYHDLQQLIRESTSDIFISPLDAIIDRLHEKGYKVGELTGRNMYVERDENGKVVVRRRTDKDKKRMQREFNNGELDVLILNKSASTGISLHASEKFSDQRQRTMIIAQPLSDINDYMQMIGRIDRTGQVHRGYYINLGLPVPAENRFLMMLSTKLKSLNANTTTSQDSESNGVEAPDLLNKYGSQVVVEYLRDNPDVYDKMGAPLKKGGENGKTPVEASELDEYKPQEDDARRITGSVALLSTKEQEDFYDDVVRRYNELMNYLNDTGNNDLKITVMPLRAKTIDKRVSSEGIDPNGSNPFAKNSYVEKVEMDVLRKPMKADEVRKTIEQVCRGQQPEDCLRGIIATIKSEDEARMAAEEDRYEKALQRAQEDIAKQTEKINSQQKRTAEEKQSAIAAYASETNERVEAKHSENKKRIKLNHQLLVSKLNMFEVGKSYLVPDNLETQMFDFAAPAIFCGYKAKESKITASTTLAVFATLDGRRRVEVKLSQLEALNSIQKMTNDNWDSARSTTLDNWDSQIPTESRKTGYIMTGNILQAIADTQDEKGGYPGQLISYTDMDGNVHDGILMPDKWNSTMLKTSGAPIISRLQQIKEYKPIVSHDGKVEIAGSAWAKTYYLTVPKTKKDGAVYYENKTLLSAAGGNFYPYHGKLRADISANDIEEVVKELSKLGVKVREEIQPDDDKTKFRLLEDDELERVNAKFNERLSELVENPNQKGKVLRLGHASRFLTDGGIADAEIVLEFDKLARKSKEGYKHEHPFDMAEVKDLPKAISSPIAVFDNTNDRNDDKVILTELNNGGRNFIVAVQTVKQNRKGGVVLEVNQIVTLFPKDAKGIVNWFNLGKATNIDKEKALHFIEALPNHPGTTIKDEELISATNVVRNFENTKDWGEKESVDKPREASSGLYTLSGSVGSDLRDVMAARVNELAGQLNTPVRIVRTDEEVVALPSVRQRRMKGSFNPVTGEVTIVVPNNANMADIENTFIHEVVGHDGLRVLFPEEEKLNNALDELYRVSKDEIRNTIDRMAQKMYDAEVDRLREKKRREHEAKGEDSNATYYADMAEAHAEASKKREQFKRDATEEYGADLAGRIGEKGFEKMSAEELTFWGKLKSMLQKALQKLLAGLKIPGKRKWSDKEWAFVLHEAYKRKKNGGKPTVFDAADTEVMRRKTGFDKVMYSDGAIREELDRVNERFNNQLAKFTLDNADKINFNLGNPSEKLLSAGVADKPIRLHGSKVAKKMKKHGFSIDELHDLPKAVANPIAVFDNLGKDGNRSVLTELKTANGNFLVTIDLGKGTEADFDIVSSVFGKKGHSVAAWINKGYMRYVDKKKALDYLHLSAPIAEASDNAELSSAAKVVENFENPTTYDGNVADDTEVIRRKTGFGETKFSDSEREQQAVNERFNHELTRYQNGEMDKNEMLHLGRPQGVMRTFLPDFPIVMRQRVIKKGSEKKHEVDVSAIMNMPQYLSSPIFVFQRSEDTIGVLTDMRDRNGKNVCVAIELKRQIQQGAEYLEVNDVRSFHGREFKNIVEPIANNKTLKWVDKEKGLAYLSSASQPVQQEIDKQVLDTATKVVKDFVNPKVSAENVEDDGIMFRDGDSVKYNKAMARDIYERRVSRGMYQMQEALQDSMLGLKEAMDAILRAEGKGKTYIEDVVGYENAYLGENRLSSVNLAECTAFARTLFKPMLEEVAKLAKTADERAELTDYMMAKHGLERNEVMARRAAEKQANEEFRDELCKAERAAAKDPLDQDAADALDDVKQRKHDREEELYFENRGRDYAGLTALTGMDNVVDAETEAQQMVADYEARHDTTDLWDKVNAVTKATLTKTYESGLINKATYDDIRGMYANYIPLRGFDDKTSDEAYAYLADKHSAFNAPIKTAKGRKSKADDPFANMEAMAESAIMQGNRNTLVKQKFLNFALNHPSDLVSVSDLWLWHNDAVDEWQPINSGDLHGTEKIEEGDSPAEVERKMHDFEEAMRQAAQSDPAHFKKQKDNPAIPYRVVESRDLRQHQVLVKRNGRDIILTINGNPRAAQALNGQTNPDNDLSGTLSSSLVNGVGKLNRFLSSVYTTKNPDFIVSNFMRDMMYANTMVWVKESPNYAWRFHKNFAKVNPAKMKILLTKLRNGMLDMNDKTEYAFHLFMMNGGETGYSNIRDIKQHKNDIMRQLKKNNGQIPVRKAWDLMWERLDEYNRAIENCARFAAFMTSRQLGRTIDRSVYDAKEISVNFNKKGSGAKFMDANGQTEMGYFAAGVSGWGRVLFVFWNAAMQGSTNSGRQFKRHPKKAIAGAASMFLLGALMAAIGGDDGDDDENKNAYYNLPEYVRRSNVVFRLSGMDKSWISMPLPVEYRAMYGMGELMVSAMSGKEHYTAGELAHQMASQVSQMLPIDFMEGGGSFKTFLPSAVKPVAEVINNESWTGMPIYKKNDYNKNDPEWTKAYKSANKYLVSLSKALNEATGGDAYTSGKIDINPAQVEYLLNGIFGGVSSTIDKLTKMGETIIGDREYDPRNFLLLNRLVKNGDERTEYRSVNNEYFRIKGESEKLRTRLNHYENDTADGVFDYADKISWLNNSPEYRILETYEEYSGDIDDINDELKEAARDGASDEERKSLEAELNQKKKELVDAVNEIRNGKR